MSLKFVSLKLERIQRMKNTAIIIISTRKCSQSKQLTLMYCMSVAIANKEIETFCCSDPIYD